MDTASSQDIHIRMTARGKRPLRNLTAVDKVRAIERIHNGETKASVSRDIGVPESTLRGWCKNEQKLRFMCRQVRSREHFVIKVPGREIPAEKRYRFNTHLQKPMIPVLYSFDEFLFNHSSPHALLFPPNNNSIFKKAKVMDKIEQYSYLDREHTYKSQIPATLSSTTNDKCDPRCGNLNLISLLHSAVRFENNFDVSSKIKLKSPLCITNCEIPKNLQDMTCFSSDSNQNMSTPSLNFTNLASSNENICVPSFTFKDVVKDRDEAPITAPDVNCTKQQKSVPLANTHKMMNFKKNSFDLSSPLSVYAQKHTFPDIFTKPISNNTKSELVEWCKVFSASLKFLTLTNAATALHPQTNKTAKSCSQIDDWFDKTMTNVVDNPVLPFKYLEPINNGLFSFHESEPEDLTLRQPITK